jgi:chromosome segregation ATPase
VSDFNQSSEVDEMLNKFSGYINHIRDTFINASQLAQEVQTLREHVQQVEADFSARVAQFDKEVSDLRQANVWADETLQRVRAERDEAQAKVQDLTTQVASEQQAAYTAQRNYEHATEQYNSLSDAHGSVKRERDDAHFRIMELEDENQRLKAQLEGIKAALGWSKTVTEEVKAPQQVAFGG